jgi:hypothetical protein
MFVVAISVTGTNVRPIPIDISINPGSRSAAVRPVRGKPAEQKQTRRRHPETDQGDRANAELPDQLLRDPGADHDPRRDRQEREAGYHWAFVTGGAVMVVAAFLIVLLIRRADVAQIQTDEPITATV